MTVTTKDTKARFQATEVEQQRGQSWVVLNSRHYTAPLFVSYATIIGVMVGGLWYFTEEKFSVSTTRQLSHFIKTLPDARVMSVDADSFTKLVQGARA